MESTTQFEKWVSAVKNHKVFAAVLIIGIAVITLANFTDAVGKILVLQS